jgi:hypothetical protein
MVGGETATFGREFTVHSLPTGVKSQHLGVNSLPSGVKLQVSVEDDGRSRLAPEDYIRYRLCRQLSLYEGGGVDRHARLRLYMVYTQVSLPKKEKEKKKLRFYAYLFPRLVLVVRLNNDPTRMPRLLLLLLCASSH